MKPLWSAVLVFQSGLEPFGSCRRSSSVRLRRLQGGLWLLAMPKGQMAYCSGSANALTPSFVPLLAFGYLLDGQGDREQAGGEFIQFSTRRLMTKRDQRRLQVAGRWRTTQTCPIKAG